MSPEDRRKAMEARLAAMSPEERKTFEERRAARAAQGGQGGQGGPGGQGGQGGQFGGGGGRGGAPTAQADASSGRRDISRGVAASIKPGPTHTSGATTIDALFGPLPVVESRGRAWLYMDKKLKPISLRLGVSDGTFTEILERRGSAGAGSRDRDGHRARAENGDARGNNANNPLMGPQRGGPGGGRGPGGGGRGQ